MIGSVGGKVVINRSPYALRGAPMRIGAGAAAVARVTVLTGFWYSVYESAGMVCDRGCCRGKSTM
jgi:hypothetical protein